MNIEKWLIDQLVRYGLWEDQAAAVIERIKADKSTQGIRWSDPIDGYTHTFCAALLMSAADEALTWIDENCPLSFFRPAFAELAGQTE